MISSLAKDGTQMGDASRLTIVLVLFAACASASRFWIMASCSCTSETSEYVSARSQKTYLKEDNIVIGVIIFVVGFGLDHVLFPHTLVTGTRVVQVVNGVERSFLPLLGTWERGRDAVCSQQLCGDDSILACG